MLSGLCRDVNNRLRRCGEFLKQGLRAEAVHLAEQERWQEAIVEGQKAVRMNPTSVEQRVLLTTCYVRSGQKGKAAKEFAEIEILRPRDLDVLRRWFADQTN